MVKEIPETQSRRIMPWGDLPRSLQSAESGVVLVDKDSAVTSHDIVGAMRKLAGTRKVGHGGTLDPMATGLLTIGIGRATKLLNYLSGCEKVYRAKICLGVATNTEDADGEIIAPTDEEKARLQALKIADIDSQIAFLTGQIMQVPSSFSALKVNGKKSYELARAGKNVDLPARPITIFDFRRLNSPKLDSDLFDFPVYLFDVEVACSAGTYIRALARDLGAALGVGAHLRMLRRIKVGAWDVSKALKIAEYRDLVANKGELPVISMSEICGNLFPKISVDTGEVEKLSKGQFISYREPIFAQEILRTGKKERNADISDEKIANVVAAFNADGKVVALLSRRGKYYKPDLQLLEIPH